MTTGKHDPNFARDFQIISLMKIGTNLWRAYIRKLKMK
jgi:hypothetical protein